MKQRKVRFIKSEIVNILIKISLINIKLNIFFKLSYKVLTRLSAFPDENRMHNAVQTFRGDIKESNKKIYNKYFKDIVKSYIYHGATPEQYFILDFELLSFEGRQSYMTSGSSKKYYMLMNNWDDIHTFNDKYKCYKKFQQYYKRDVIKVKSKDDFEFFQSFSYKHKRFIRKPLDKNSGEGIKVLELHKFNSDEACFNYLLHGGECVLEELIVQDEVMKNLHPHSVNTVRIVTVVYPDGVKIQQAILRTGRNDSNVDNMGAGGLGAEIDVNTGTVITTAVDKFNKRYIHHPDTNVQIVGFQIPKWDELVGTAQEIAQIIPSSKQIGWDFALTNKGWVVIEGNFQPGLWGLQLIINKGNKYLYEQILHEIGVKDVNL